ncbi:MAG: hypothetical protein GOV00_01960 [Candidatus Altiarchaeota archaeon]|nr:hypothetical protein [Candidatus Altiarchaeota archaeon]
MSPHIGYSDIGPKAKLVEFEKTSDSKLIFSKIASRKADDEQIIFSGSDVLEHPNILQFIKAARDRTYKIIQVIATGKKLSSPDFLIECVLSGLTDISLKIIKLTPDDEATIKNILNLRKVVPQFFKPTLSVGIYVSEKTKSELIQTLKKLETLKVPEIFIINTNDSKTLDISDALQNRKTRVFTIGFEDKHDYKTFCKNNRVLVLSS